MLTDGEQRNNIAVGRCAERDSVQYTVAANLSATLLARHTALTSSSYHHSRRRRRLRHNKCTRVVFTRYALCALRGIATVSRPSVCL